MPASASIISQNSYEGIGGVPPFGGHQFGSPPSYDPLPAAAAAVSPSVSVQLYDEFVSRGNVAVLKCLVITLATNLASAAAVSSSSRSGVHQGPSSAKASFTSQQHSYPSSAYQYQRDHFASASSSSSFSGLGEHWWAESGNAGSLASEFAFEWRIKNGPAASAATGETILTLRSNQTQGMFKYFLFFICTFTLLITDH